MNRRKFLHNLATGTAATLGTSALPFLPAWAQSAPSADTLTLTATKRTLDINGKAANVYGLLQPNGTLGAIINPSAPFDVNLTNDLDEPTLIHWHGQTPPWAMDGVPDTPLPLLKPSEARRYTFPAAVGTHWMHAHTLQEQNLLAAPLIVHTDADLSRDEQEVVILLHDFSFTPATELLAKLKGQNGAAANAMPMNHGTMNHGAMNHMGMMGSQSMPMSGMGVMDFNDIEYDAYLANDRTLSDPQVVSVEKNGRVRLRIINGATASAFTIDTGAIEGELIAVDGQDVTPIKGKAFPILMGQRLDIRFGLPKDGGAFPILALREGALERTGIILKSPQAQISKLALTGQSKGAIVNLDLERRLVAVRPLAKRATDRRYTVTLFGDMASYEWGIDGGNALKVKQGERVEITIRNMSMMTHPMHMHGHHFQIVGIDGRRMQGAVRDTVALPHMASVTLALDATNPGRWAFHCHHLYHMATGMMAFVKYDGVA